MSSRWCLGIAVLVGALAMCGSAAASADTLSATCSWGTQSQTCNSNVWYPSAVTWYWQASPQPDIVSCGLDVNNHYDTDTVNTVSCTATWNSSGTTITQQYTLHVETSTPTASAAPARGPDSNGWYNHPVTAAVTGSSFSGIASCTPTTYSGPDSTTATVSGTCTDNAGKSVSAASPAFPYDASPPALTVATSPGDGVVVLHWATSDIAPLTSVTIERKPGHRGKAASFVYRKLGSRFWDKRVRNGVRYRYTLVATDQAGNTTTRTIMVRPGPRLLAPGARALLTSPPMLRWTAVRGATYYNVQLYRGDRKILTTWPARHSLQLSSIWRFDGHRYHLKPGRYRWYVWPGFGSRSAARYGGLIGSRKFTMK